MLGAETLVRERVQKRHPCRPGLFRHGLRECPFQQAAPDLGKQPFKLLIRDQMVLQEGQQQRIGQRLPHGFPVRRGGKFRLTVSQQGDRRPLRFTLTDPVVKVVEHGFQLEFTLPKGCYATAVLRELMKPA